MSTTLKELYSSYSRWVSSNPKLTTDIENSLKWISYLVTGQMSSSDLLSELVFTLSNLLVLINDDIIAKSVDFCVDSSQGAKLKTWITIVEYSEVFLELTALSLYGKVGKWTVIVVIQLFKAIGRIILLFVHRQNLLSAPAIKPLIRKTILNSEETYRRQLNDTFQLRSGKTIRSINSVSSLGSRSWVPPESPLSLISEGQGSEGLIGKKQLVGEALYIFKPIIHLYSLHYYGEKSWPPWFISLATEVISLQLIRQGNPSVITKKQQLELARRYLQVFYYLLRSPFFDHHSKFLINSVLMKISTTVPTLSFIVTPYKDYLPKWQQIYFYLWSR